MINVLLVLGMIALCLVAMMTIPAFMTKRAMGQVIRILKFSGTTTPEDAKTAAELRLTPPTFVEKFMKPRDYKPKALEMLISMDIVRFSSDNRIYLSEKNLLASPLVQRWPSLAKDIK